MTNHRALIVMLVHPVDQLHIAIPLKHHDEITAAEHKVAQLLALMQRLADLRRQYDLGHLRHAHRQASNQTNRRVDDHQATRLHELIARVVECVQMLNLFTIGYTLDHIHI